MEMNSYNNVKDYREERRYSVPHGPNGIHHNIPAAASEDLHAWSIYRQNLNSDFTDSALGSSDKSPLPYGNFQLRDTTVQSILSHPRYGPKSALGSNMYTYLKFGLPRVFPPGSQRSNKLAPAAQRGRVNRGFRDTHTAGSSGYESSDNETTRGRAPQNLRKFRSESDFRNISVGAPIQKNMHSRPVSRLHGNIPAALKQPNSRASIAGTHLNHYAPQHAANNRSRQNRSHSEADLLGGGNIGAEMIYDYDTRIYGDTRQVRSERQSQALIYPNIQVQSLDVNSGVRGVTIQAKAGDLLAIMATSTEEGTSLIETIAGLRERLGGDIFINGQLMSKKILKQLIGYVPAPDFASLDPRMSVQNTLSFHAALNGPIDKSDLKERIDILVEDLGLTAVRSANVCRLTHSEKQRLNVACQLMTQCSILVLDKTTKNMDIFDTFFLVEYLRQWCSAGRIVMMTLQPPTFEILSMCSKVLLLSGGRTIFSGSRSDLPRQLGSMGYPCPPFKNPADYYLDLVTLDDLSAAALLESSARIESLANAWERISLEGANQPVPIANLPNPIKKSSNFGQITTLAKRYMNYKQPGSLLSWISRLIVAAFLSLFVGGIFWDVMSDPQLNLNDRLGYHYTVMTVAIWPIILMLIQDTQNDRKYAEVDIRLKLYGRGAYIFVQILFSILPSAFIWLAFLLPCHSMAGLNSYTINNDNGVYVYMGYMLLYLLVIQTLTLFASHLLPLSKLAATIFTAIIVLIITSPGGYMIHNSSTNHLSFLAIISPQKWLLPLLTKDEYSPETLASTTSGIQLCRNKQVQHQEIIVQQPCPLLNGTMVLADFHLLPSDHVLNPSDIYSSTLVALLLAIATLIIFSVIIFLLNTRKLFKKSKRF